MAEEMTLADAIRNLRFDRSFKTFYEQVIVPKMQGVTAEALQPVNRPEEVYERERAKGALYALHSLVAAIETDMPEEKETEDG